MTIRADAVVLIGGLDCCWCKSDQSSSLSQQHPVVFKTSVNSSCIKVSKLCLFFYEYVFCQLIIVNVKLKRNGDFVIYYFHKSICLFHSLKHLNFLIIFTSLLRLTHPSFLLFYILYRITILQLLNLEWKEIFFGHL